jgi:hypothetical protein
MRALNQIDAPINGVNFTPGPFLIDSSEEQWGTYYPSSFGGFPFTIFYKEEIPSFIYRYTRAVFENLYDLKTYNELIFTPRFFLIGYDGMDGEDEVYEILMPRYLNYELKHFETIY